MKLAALLMLLMLAACTWRIVPPTPGVDAPLLPTVTNTPLRPVPVVVPKVLP